MTDKEKLVELILKEGASMEDFGTIPEDRRIRAKRIASAVMEWHEKKIEPLRNVYKKIKEKYVSIPEDERIPIKFEILKTVIEGGK